MKDTVEALDTEVLRGVTVGARSHSGHSVGLTIMEVTLIYSSIGKSGANPSKNVFERKKIGQDPLDTVSDLSLIS